MIRPVLLLVHTIIFIAILLPFNYVLSDVNNATNDENSRLLPFDAYRCYVWCTAKCMKNDKKSMNECRKQCVRYQNEQLCTDETCWRQCKDIGVDGSTTKTLPSPPSDVSVSYASTDANSVNVSWQATIDAQFYLVEYSESPFNTWNDDTIEITDTSFIWHKPPASFCSQFEFRVFAVSADGPSIASPTALLSVRKPSIVNVSIASMIYRDRPYNYMDVYKFNGTIEIILDYAIEPVWPFGIGDLNVSELFNLVNCQVPALSYAVPTPTFTHGPGANQVSTEVANDMMLRRCTVIVNLDVASSQRCGIRFDSDPLTQESFVKIDIECSTVQQSGCSLVDNSKDPICGQVDNFHYQVLNGDKLDANDHDSNISIRITFDPIRRYDLTNNVLYYVAQYGNAVPYADSMQEAFFGVNITDELGQATSCTSYADHQCDGDDDQNSTSTSIVISGLKFDTLYGVVLCGIRDAANTKLPEIDPSENRATKPKADKIMIQAIDYMPFRYDLLFGILVPSIIVVAALIYGIVYLIRRQNRKIINDKMAIEREVMQARYTVMPKKNDLWEMERRNLLIHNDKKLGSGAFGAVFLGRYIGRAVAHKDSTSALGVNLMRIENCDVAVKMLPEYADDMSKSEFLKEINLMKSLGYHERLVNMLACITNTEPYCLVVEYCSDGDLLHFLRDRCKYMLKLDELGVNYKNPSENDEFDENMIVTLKQLLMFAVQISYGLEYLSQKGFIHRDVAARNVLVHNGTEAKIGDFGLCRYVYADQNNYKCKGGRLPVKWMSPEAIRYYEFSCKSDVWSFGILMFEVITLGGSPYPGVQPDDMQIYLENGRRLEQPDNCPDNYYDVMTSCWRWEPNERPTFNEIRQKLASQLEEVTEAYAYLSLDGRRDYYNVEYREDDEMTNIVDDNRKISVENSSISIDDDESRHQPIDSIGDIPTSGRQLAERAISDASDVTLITPVEMRSKQFNF